MATLRSPTASGLLPCVSQGGWPLVAAAPFRPAAARVPPRWPPGCRQRSGSRAIASTVARSPASPCPPMFLHGGEPQRAALLRPLARPSSRVTTPLFADTRRHRIFA